MNHPEIADLIATHPEAADALSTALSRGVLLAGKTKARPNKSETATLPLVTQGMVRGVVLTRLLLMHYDWLESNGLGGTEKKSAKELRKLVQEQYLFLRGKTAKRMGVLGDGTPEQNLSAYLQAATDLYWDVFEEADKADDARLMLALCQCYTEGLVTDASTGKVVSAQNEAMYGTAEPA